jgi:hypothetical protein
MPPAPGYSPPIRSGLCASARPRRFLAECGGRIIVPAAMLLKMRAHRPEIQRYWSADYPNCQFASPVPLRGRRRGRVLIQLKAQAPLWRLLPAFQLLRPQTRPFRTHLYGSPTVVFEDKTSGAQPIQNVRRKGIWGVWSASPPAGQDPASMPCRALALRRASEAAADLALGPAAPLAVSFGSSGAVSRAALALQRSEVRIPSAPPGSPRSVPDTWASFYSGDIGNTFGPKGFMRKLFPKLRICTDIKSSGSRASGN